MKVRYLAGEHGGAFVISAETEEDRASLAYFEKYEPRKKTERVSATHTCGVGVTDLRIANSIMPRIPWLALMIGWRIENFLKSLERKFK